MLAQTQDCGCEAEGEFPGAGLDSAKMPAHWLLARLGKRVLRPGGLGLTRRMLSGLKLVSDDSVVEFAPGLGVTARLALKAGPARYTAVERDASAAKRVRRWLDDGGAKSTHQVITGFAQNTGLPDACASVVYGEAMLTMQSENHKRQIIREAFRLLRPGGRYGIHELCVVPDTLADETLKALRHDLTQMIRHNAQPLSGREWEALLRDEGFEVECRLMAPMALLEPLRVLRDEGIAGAGRFVWRLACDAGARRRVRSIRGVFRQYRRQMAAICFIARKPAEGH